MWQIGEVRANSMACIGALLLTGTFARGGAALFVEEPFANFGAFNPTGHAAVYLSHVCADSPVHLRLCEPGEGGVVISRYHHVGGYDWIAIPLIPYLYAVDTPAEIPSSANRELVEQLRDQYRRAHLSSVVPDGPGGAAPGGEWIQLVGSSYDRKIYSYEIETTEEQDLRLIEALNARKNKTHFNLLFYNCADFVRFVLDFYYPHAVHRGIFNDFGIMTPKQAGRTLAKYSRRHSDLEFTCLEIPQVPGLPRSGSVKGVMESFVKSKKYVVPVAALHPLVLGGIAVVYVTEAIFQDRPPRVKEDPEITPQQIATELEGGGARSQPLTVNLR